MMATTGANGAAFAALRHVGNDAQIGLLGMVILIEDMARDGTEMAAESGQLGGRQMLPGKHQKEMFQQRRAQRRRLALGERAGEVEPLNLRTERGARGFDRKCHAHSSITSTASR